MRSAPPRTSRTAFRRSGLVWIGAAVATAAVVLGVALFHGGPSAEEPKGLPASASVAEVLAVGSGDTVTTFEGEPVTGAEVLRAAESVRAEVISTFTRYGTPLGPGFWDRPHDGVTPRRRLRERAVGAAVLDKARRVWAREAGLLTDVSEQGFQRELAQENGERAAAAAGGRPLPGVPSYDEHTYARVRAAELDSALSKIYAGGLDLSEARLREQYRIMAGQGAPPFEKARDNVRQALVLREYRTALGTRAGYPGIHVHGGLDTDTHR
ncbi:hypothetical protein [Nonomuraea dietziae]|uniref:hypothetical protein n=1 Tax=Nonomuraea dietziae TaxID=65515 RepID=UPI0033E41959